MMWGLDTAEAKHIFRILDANDAGEVCIEDFLTGEAKQIDMTLLMYENKRMTDKWTRFVTYSIQEFEHVKTCLDTLTSNLMVAVEEEGHNIEAVETLVKHIGEMEDEMQSGA